MISDAQMLYQGQTCRIYKLNNTETGKQEIVKVLQQDAPNYQVALLFMQNEYDLSKNLTHVGTRKALRMGNFEQSPALFLEYVEGSSLSTLSQDYSIGEILEIAIQITERLAYLHQHNIIHKDLNPNNILIDVENMAVTLIDFGISSRVSQKQHHLGNPKHLEGTLRYISPEQTGRVNKVVDYRTDLYSLGVLLYELFTGNVPFEHTDPMELVHAHITTLPIPIHEVNSTIFLPISKIITKLLQKNVENRYQTALGLQFDLEHCLGEFNKNKTITDFKLGQKDYSGKLQLPQKLYGREKESSILLEAFERVSQGGKELLLVGGYSGVGKSALVNEVHKPITEKRGYFIGGKYDQYQRNIPYYAMRKTFAELIGYWLLEEEQIVQQWKNKIQSVLGELAKVITEVIPELELLIGEPAEVPHLEGEQYANRFNYVFGLFMNAICSEEHPLVIFIDDWQWADNASLELFKVLLADESLKNVLFIGAYRDNEVDESHPFVQMLYSIEKAGITPVQYVILKNLWLEDVEEWVKDALQEDEVIELVKLIYAKTQGNAFFTAQFLQTLFEEKLLYFNFAESHWTWDIQKIQAQNITDNVIDLMTNKIQKLPSKTQELLKMGACVGASFELEVLATMAGCTIKECHEILEEALIAGLLLKRDAVTYRFVHDRVQQATYGLLSEHKQKELHYTIGNLWLESVQEIEREDKLMDIVSQLNFGLDLIQSDTEKETLFSLNLEAGNKAKSAIAYVAAHEHFRIAGSLLPSTTWVTNYETTFELYKNWGEVAFLINKKEESEKLLTIALEKAKDEFDKTEIHILRIRQKASEGQYLEASEEGALALNLFGYNLPSMTNQEFYVQAGNEEVGKYLEQIKRISPEGLKELPILTEKVHLTCIHIINVMFDGVFMGAPYAYLYISAKAINISLQHGQSRYISQGILNISFAHCSMNEYELFYELSQVALYFRNKYQFKEFDARFYLTLGYASLTQDMQTAIDYLVMAFQKGLEVGDFSYAVYGITAGSRSTNVLSLETMLEQIQIGERFYRKIDNPIMLLVGNMHKGYALNMKGQTNSKLSFSFDGFDEEEYIEIFTKVSAVWIMAYRRFKIQSLVLWGAYDEAYFLVQNRVEGLTMIGGIDIEYKGGYYFYCVLTVIALYKQEKISEEEMQTVLEEGLREIELLAQANSSSFASIYHIVLAQKAELENNAVDAMNEYDTAIELAVENELWSYVAIGNELAMQFYLSLSKPQFASLYLTNAINYYRLWGADGKANMLEQEYHSIYRKIVRHHTATNSTYTATHTLFRTTHQSQTTSHSMASTLDMNTLLKASQALSKEIQLESLLQKMLRILIENAGADKGILLLEQDEKWFIQGEIYGTGEEKILHQLPLEEGENILSGTVINYVINSKQLLVSEDVLEDTRLTKSTYIQQSSVKSLLCLPIVNQSKLIGILYLENSVVTGAFSQDRVDLLSSLASQVAISIENALLYENLEDKVAKRTAEVERQKNILIKSYTKLKNTQSQLVQAEKMATLGMLTAGVAHEINNPINFVLAGTDTLEVFFEDMQTMLENYERFETSTTQELAELQAEITEWKEDEELDLEEIVVDVKNLMSDIRTGASRTAEIVQSLKILSRLDENEMKWANLHENIDSVLVILRNQFMGHVTLQKNYTSSVISVECFIGKINQAFLNTIHFSVDNIKDKGTLDISTEVQGDWVEIRFKDSGKPLSPDALVDWDNDTVNLQVAKNILEEHHGELELCPHEFGNEVIMRMPVSQD